MIRFLILTDSLGCPRSEITVSQTWTDQILQEYNNKNVVFYTYCIRGLSSKDIPFTYIKDISPDVIICQVGIVDACRRAISLRSQRIISYIPIVRRIVKAVTSKYHYQLTRLRSVHYVEIDAYVKNLKSLEGLCKKALIISILPPGGFLIKKTWRVAEDVKEYNIALHKALDKKRSLFLEVFPDALGDDIDKYLLATDGHHLNIEGNACLFKCVKKMLDIILEEYECK